MGMMLATSILIEVYERGLNMVSELRWLILRLPSLLNIWMSKYVIGLKAINIDT